MGETPIPVYERFTDKQKNEILGLWNQGWSQQRIADKFVVSRRAIMKLCAYLGLKRTIKEAAMISTKSPLDKLEVIEKIMQLRNSKNLDEIVGIVGGSPSAIHRLCNKYGIKLDKQAYAAVQSERMKGAWTEEKRLEISGSRYRELNNEEWLKEHYINKDLSMGEIAKMIGAPLISVSHHLRRHNIPIKTKEQYLEKLRRKSANRQLVVTKWGSFTVQSQAELEFLQFLEKNDSQIVEYEPITLQYANIQYVPDFRVDGDLVEVKPPEYAIEPGIDRQKFIRQLLIAQRNEVSIKCWYRKKGYYNVEPINDVDRYFCSNWKLLFNSVTECHDFLISYGFHSLQWSRDRLLTGMNYFFKARGDDRLNANFLNSHSLDFIKHFNPHFWSSSHRGYNTIKMAFEDGNKTILKQAIEDLWGTKKNINIYGLVNLIAKRFKDFATVSIFKPWVARFIYDELLPSGGVVIDPCMGWGGRLLGTLDSNVGYIGFDLNPKVIEAHKNMREFIGARMSIEPRFSIADASSVIWPKGNLLFTSPPYDDTEYYDGLPNQCKDSSGIYRNIMRFEGMIALNIPKRHRDGCIAIAKENGRKLLKEYEMRTSSFMGKRDSTFEPILVFRAK